MLKKIWNNKYRLSGVFVIILLLLLIRYFEKNIFYDPFILYYKDEFTSLPLPSFNVLKLIFSLFARYSLNSLLSIGLLYFIFKDPKMIPFICLIYSLLFTLLVVIFFGLIFLNDLQNNMIIFYIRRFLIQPLFVLLFIPAFWFQKKQQFHKK